MASDFTIYQVKSDYNLQDFPYTTEQWKLLTEIFTERRPVELRFIQDQLIKNGNNYGDDFVEITPSDYELFKDYVNLTKHHKDGYKFICITI